MLSNKKLRFGFARQYIYMEKALYGPTNLIWDLKTLGSRNQSDPIKRRFVLEYHIIYLFLNIKSRLQEAKIESTACSVNDKSVILASARLSTRPPFYFPELKFFTAD